MVIVVLGTLLIVVGILTFLGPVIGPMCSELVSLGRRTCGVIWPPYAVADGTVFIFLGWPYGLAWIYALLARLCVPSHIQIAPDTAPLDKL